FSHTHLSGTGCGCVGDVLLMPAVGEIEFDAKGHTSRFSHEQEHATPGDYRVFLDDPKVAVELTATARCGFHKYTFPETPAAHVILDLEHGVGNNAVETSLEAENDTTVSGCRISQGWGGRRAIYFVLQFSKPFASFGVEQNGQRLAAAAKDAQGKSTKAFFNYQTTANEAVLVRVGI